MEFSSIHNNQSTTNFNGRVGHSVKKILRSKAGSAYDRKDVRRTITWIKQYMKGETHGNSVLKITKDNELVIVNPNLPNGKYVWDVIGPNEPLYKYTASLCALPAGNRGFYSPDCIWMHNLFHQGLDSAKENAKNLCWITGKLMTIKDALKIAICYLRGPKEHYDLSYAKYVYNEIMKTYNRERSYKIDNTKCGKNLSVVSG